MKELIYFIKRLYSFTGKILFINLFGMVLVSFLDGVGMLLLIPMLSIGGILEMGNTSSMLGLLDFLKDFPESIGLPFILGVYITLVIGQSLLEKSIAIRDVIIQQGFLNGLKEEIYQSIMFVKWDFFLKTRKSDLINSLTKDINRVGMGIKMFLLLVSNLIFTVIQIGIAFWLSARISGLVLICGLALAFFSWKFVKQAKLLGKETTQLSRKYLAGITDNLNGIKDIKTNTLEVSRMQWLRTLNKRMLKEQVKYVKLQSNTRLSYKLALSVIITCFIFLSVNLFHSKPEKLLIVILLFSRLWPRFVSIQSNLQQLASTLPAFKVLLDLQNRTKGSAEMDFGDDENIKPLYVKKMIECRNVFFRYNVKTPTYALRNISVQIPTNYMTAIVGHSGAGKSTLVDIIMGLNHPESGDLLIDGVPLTGKNLLALRKSISFVPQDPFLFNSSIRQNLLLMEPNATEEQMWEALELAAADDFVKRLSKGLDTKIGDRGIRLSGGERQRLVLARAILRKPSILVLDEPTSALDTENEKRIQEALQKLKKKMTILIIAHRPSTINHADQVIVLDQGEIIQKGEYKQLINEKKEVLLLEK
ncbi:ABC transporter ATP-binding protein [Bacillus canaveralius]|uniref:ABC transporter ATP-binding protein n=1 Tax=Bacillus canaveralius TaxID=1403243 RepID=A0A2N5GNI8_9BACI|nr:ABC transporter ATP-binding protein [Bacillus canaveralius]PLR84040.1 ABC transporter ATP-binding protein [Bacillus canaveralius]PLR96315.1 ABC transporter ATP-binding protein [Bacillus canaveralius]